MIKPGKNAHFLSDLLKKVDEMEPENEVSAQVNSSFCFKNKIAEFTQSLSIVRANLFGCAMRSFTSFGKTNVGKILNVKLPKSLGEINPDTNLESQCLSGDVPSKDVAFSKPSRGASDSRRRTITNGNDVSRLNREWYRFERGAAFTLAEVLVTLGIIGIVAAMTFPALIAHYKDTVKAKRIENIKQKLSQVTDSMSAVSGINGWGNTEKFVEEMSKYVKLAAVCDNSNIAGCWPTREVILNDEGKTWEIGKTINAKTLKISSNVADRWTDTVGIITVDGTAMILSYDKDCNFNPDITGYAVTNGLSNSTSCLSGVFDWNGTGKPNKLGEDVITLGVAKGLGNSCAFESDGVCFSAPFIPEPLTKAECDAQKDALGIKKCEYLFNSLPDYWAGAVAKCGGVGNMPTMSDLAKFGKLIYGKKIYSYNTSYTGKMDPKIISSFALRDTYNDFYVWSGEEVDGQHAYIMNYKDYMVNVYRDTRFSSASAYAMCVDH